jgi:hypothetical protein
MRSAHGDQHGAVGNASFVGTAAALARWAPLRKTNGKLSNHSRNCSTNTNQGEAKVFPESKNPVKLDFCLFQNLQE